MRRAVTLVLVFLAATLTGGLGSRGQDHDALPDAPRLPEEPYEYAGVELPAHFTDPDASLGNVAGADNTPEDNPITNEGAALGRVLFYDRRLSANGTVSCSSCHRQEHGFSDPERFSTGYDGRRTRRRSMGLTNARYYESGRFFWDERATTLEELVLERIRGEVEMGMDVAELETKLAAADFYPPLFAAAFGEPAITGERIAKALAQFVRSLVSYRSLYDEAFAQGQDGIPNVRWIFSSQEKLGLRLFATIPGDGWISLRCDRCHQTAAQISDRTHNNGLDEDTSPDQGAGDGRFKAPSLRNVAVRAPYMHDGRFATLREVIEHYNEGVRPHAGLDVALMNGTLPRTAGMESGRGESDDRQRNPYGAVRKSRRWGRPLADFGLRGANGTPQRLGLTEEEIDALVAFLATLTDKKLLHDPRFSDPFED